jgi:UDP-N-acetylmuramoylalanine--D-glutamate ligase
VIGEMGKILVETLLEQGVVATFCHSLKEAVTRAYEEVTERTNVLFSPGFASFDCFSNYAERGKSFVDFVFDLKKFDSGTTQVSIN